MTTYIVTPPTMAETTARFRAMVRLFRRSRVVVRRGKLVLEPRNRVHPNARRRKKRERR